MTDTYRPIKIFPDGTMLFAHGHPVPDSIPGYYCDPGDKHVWHPDFASDCIHRKTFTTVKPCKALRCGFTCALLNKEVNQLICNSCDQVEEPK